MPKTNYAYEKRQRELERKRRKEDKAQRKAAAPGPTEIPPAEPSTEGVTSAPEPASLA
jgi:hypothetical protein